MSFLLRTEFISIILIVLLRIMIKVIVDFTIEKLDDKFSKDND